MMLGFMAIATFVVQQQPMRTNPWQLSNQPAGAYTILTEGSPLVGDGRVAIRAANTGAESIGRVSFVVSADTLRMRRVTVSGDVRGHGTAGLFITGSNTAARLSSTNGGPVAAADTQWTARSFALIVSRAMTDVAIIISVRGMGDIEARNLRLSVENLPLASTPLSDEARRELDSAITITRRASFWRDTISWSSVESDVRAFAAGAQTAAQTYPAIRELLMRLGDHHSFLMPAQETAQWQGGTIAKNPLPTVKSLEGGVGYISVPGYNGGDPASMREHATGTHSLLVTTAPASTCGWILDLRQNTGGNMWPMLAALKPFVGEAPLGSFSGPNGNGAPWKAGQNVNAEPPASLMSLDSSAVAVLIGPRTASSGEAVAVAFHGRSRTRFFGQPTAGLANANGSMKLPDGAMMMVMTSVDVDRNGQRFGEKVNPDETIGGVVSPISLGTMDDPAIVAAVKWLKAERSCRVSNP
jgi:hypothetical protein